MIARRLTLFVILVLALAACEGPNHGRDISGQTLSYSEWRPINPRDLKGNIFNAFVGSTLVDAKVRIRNQQIQNEQVTVRNEGSITTERHIVGNGTWSSGTYEVYSYANSFRRRIELDNPTALKVEFTSIRPLTNPHYLVNGFVSDVLITNSDGRVVKCAIARGAYGGFKPTPNTNTMNSFSELRTLLRATFCGPNQTAVNLERRLQNVAFGPLPLPVN